MRSVLCIMPGQTRIGSRCAELEDGPHHEKYLRADEIELSIPVPLESLVVIRGMIGRHRTWTCCSFSAVPVPENLDQEPGVVEGGERGRYGEVDGAADLLDR